jgi:hypothetical protein
LEPLVDLPQLESLDLSATPVWDLSPLKGLANLKSLFLQISSVVDLAPLKGLKNLALLNISMTKVQDLSALSGLPNLMTLDIGYTAVTDLSPLHSCKNLRTLNMRTTKIGSLAFAYELENLSYLACSSTNIDSLAPISGSRLIDLDIEKTRITDLAPLNNVVSLESLDIAHTGIVDIEPVRGLKKLQWLRLDYSKVSDLSPILNLKSLALPSRRYFSGLSFNGCPIADKEIRRIDNVKGKTDSEKAFEVINYLRRLQGLEPFKEEDIKSEQKIDTGRDFQLPALDNVPSPFAFGLSPTGTVVLSVSPANWPIFPSLSSAGDHVNRLDACRALGKDLVSDLQSKRYQAREEYEDGLERYLERLPDKPGSGNILLADAEARTLRNLFAAESEILSVAFSSKLKTFLEQHIGLRVFYPDIAKFYRDVQTGRLERSLSLDAVEGFVREVQENTPEIFDPSVAATIEGSADDAEQPFYTFRRPHDDEIKSPLPAPPKDPLGDLDPKSSFEFTFAGAANGVWRAFLQGEKINKAIEGWRQASINLQPHISEILHWLGQFVSTSGGPPPPGISV